MRNRLWYFGIIRKALLAYHANNLTIIQMNTQNLLVKPFCLNQNLAANAEGRFAVAAFQDLQNATHY